MFSTVTKSLIYIDKLTSFRIIMKNTQMHFLCVIMLLLLYHDQAKTSAMNPMHI